MRPQVGTEVTVVVKGHGHPQVFVPMYNQMTPASPDTLTYTGTVTRPDVWLKNDEFNLTTNIKSFPIRTISLKNVVSIDGSKVSAQTDSFKTVTVQGSKGNTYEVLVRNGVAETCSCPAFLYRGGRCKHLSIAVGAAPEPKKAEAVKAHKAKAAKVTKIERARELYLQCKGDRKSTIQALKRTLKMSDAGASTYYHKIKKEA